MICGQKGERDRAPRCAVSRHAVSYRVNVSGMFAPARACRVPCAEASDFDLKERVLVGVVGRIPYQAHPLVEGQAGR